MSAYRYGRTTRTASQKSAERWQREVDELNRSLELYAQQEVPLTRWQTKDWARKQVKLFKLMEENPNE